VSSCWRIVLAGGLVGLFALQAVADTRVQDIARLQGQRTNRITGFGLVVGLNGTGDGEKYLPTMRALMRLHQRFHQPILMPDDIKGNQSVALVMVTAEIPEYGAREGQTIDVTVSVIGSASSLVGGQLLITPLQYAMFNEEDPSTQGIWALAGGQVFLPNTEIPTRAVIRQGATIERDYYHWFIQDGAITLVLDDTHATIPWAHSLARALNHELSNPALQDSSTGAAAGPQPALALDGKNVRVKIPDYELKDPAGFISRVLQTRLFMLPEQEAKVTINRTTKHVAFTGNVTISPTVLQIPGMGTVLIGKSNPNAADGQNEIDAVQFKDLLATLSAISVTPDQLINAVEHLHRTGALHAQLRYK
jgi:flagellar P-ring protein precursor FlgI